MVNILEVRKRQPLSVRQEPRQCSHMLTSANQIMLLEALTSKWTDWKRVYIIIKDSLLQSVRLLQAYYHIAWVPVLLSPTVPGALRHVAR